MASPSVEGAHSIRTILVTNTKRQVQYAFLGERAADMIHDKEGSRALLTPTSPTRGLRPSSGHSGQRIRYLSISAASRKSFGDQKSIEIPLEAQHWTEMQYQQRVGNEWRTQLPDRHLWLGLVQHHLGSPFTVFERVLMMFVLLSGNAAVQLAWYKNASLSLLSIASILYKIVIAIITNGIVFSATFPLTWVFRHTLPYGTETLVKKMRPVTNSTETTDEQRKDRKSVV